MKLKELIREEKILPKISEKEWKKIFNRLKLLPNKDRNELMIRINRIRKSEGLRPTTFSALIIGKKEKQLEKAAKWRGEGFFPFVLPGSYYKEKVAPRKMEKLKKRLIKKGK